jgi:predicted  nucleic acid-binding Zn-ribbon protein
MRIAHDEHGLAAVEGGNCTHCRIGLTQQQLGDLSNENFACCKNCGRAQYLVRASTAA